MSQGVSHYPISLLLNRVIIDSGLTRAGFVRSLGYQNLQKGLRRLHAWLGQGKGHPVIIKRVISGYAGRFNPNEFSLALAATSVLQTAQAESAKAERVTAEYKAFRPYIAVDGERSVPSSICLFGITGAGWNLIELPEQILNLSLADQIAALPGLFRIYLESYQGFSPFNGRVTGFRLVRWSESLRFTIDGEIVEVVPGRFRRAQTTLTVGHKTATFT